jgi:predicted aspartyl protease
MQNLIRIISPKNYKKIKFKITKTNHLLIRVKINSVLGNFILDTGASNSCVGFDEVNLFQLVTQKSKTKAAGAGATGMETQFSENNILEIGTWKKKNFDLVIFDLSHVNLALVEHQLKSVHGIIGSDVLITSKAIIDYENCFLYLKNN